MRVHIMLLIDSFRSYLNSTSKSPLFLCGDSLHVLSALPSHSIDCCMTSPPYWNQREYHNGGIGLEDDYLRYIANLLEVTQEIFRVLKDSGSFWLNLGDSYLNKRLLGIPWRIAIEMGEQQNWIMRNDVIWNKIKGMDTSKDKLRPVHEHLFHFVKHNRYHYDLDAIRSKPRRAKVKNGAVVSATGVTGVKYKRQIELSTSLDEKEKVQAESALSETLRRLESGEISDFRMVIRKQHRTTHSDSTRVSGRAKELAEKGFYFLYYHQNGSKPGDVWEILPEDTSNRGTHYAVYPEDLCKIPILATCPLDGIVLDPFCGSGTTNVVAFQLERKSIGIDISRSYVEQAKERCKILL
ncbi:MAG: site-specific DNA-methyltransferase [Chloroflexi bacterium]|nr:site-specific DNA-methyltransferase [Chloroflexota bacterium]MYA92100.1 site-specific DNA-methyltransferase [Chloroflexota bacterium]MYD39779.1 site-specific DNA-methyltransferase [Chloroflexota bacterium]MYH65904.1 site-specific DNA-methyltransferase [Chloroflexota bacterium]